MADVEALTERIIGCAIEVHRELGPGLLESIYRDCLAIELTACGLPFSREHRVHVRYKGKEVRDDLRIDLLVAEVIVVETKAVDHLHPVHLAQVITYLKLTGCPAGLLLNFNATSLRGGLRRLYHPDIYAQRRAKRLSEPPSSDPPPKT